MEISVKNLNFGYIKRPLSLIDVNFSLQSGEIALLCGGEGSGKTSLLSVLSGLESQYFGNILYDDKNLREITKEEKCISFIMSEPVFFENKSILYNLKYQLKVNSLVMSEDEILSVCKLLNFDFPLKIKVKKLKSADKKILSLIRSYIKKPKYVFIDDLFVEKQNDDKIFTKIKNAILTYVNDKKWVKTVILVDGNGRFADVSSKILYLNYGKMWQFRSINELKNNVVDMHVLNYFKHVKFELYLAYDGQDYYFIDYEKSKDINKKTKKQIQYKELRRIKIDKKLYEKLSKTVLGENQEMEVVLSCFDENELQKLSDADISKMLESGKLNLFEKNTSVKIV